MRIILTVLAITILSGCQTLMPSQVQKSIVEQSPVDRSTLASPAEIAAVLFSPVVEIDNEQPTVEIAKINKTVIEIDDEENIVEAVDKVKTIPRYDNVWDRIRENITFDIPQNRAVVAQRNWYASHQAYLDRVADRADPFLYYIVEEIEKRGLPIELALLPIVESAFDPFAYSHGRASGMWQFIPGTGTRFGLKQNWWYDGRRDIIASTQGALDYLTHLNKIFKGDWLNAIAAYNSGEGRVRRSIRKNEKKRLPTDFFSLDLPRETSAYVPKLLALVDIVRDPQKFALFLKPIKNEPKIDSVDVGSQIDLALVANMAELTMGEIYGLNPGYKQWATDPEGPYSIVLPVDKVEKFKQQLAKTDLKQRLVWQNYKVKSGDSLNKIAHKFHTTAEIIQGINRLDKSLIRVGEQLLIPVAAQDPEVYAQTLAYINPKPKPGWQGASRVTYKVKKEDTLWDISRMYDVSIRSLAKWNGMAPIDLIHPGQLLVIWKQPEVASVRDPNNQIALRTVTYTVKRGDSLSKIAGKFNITVQEIVRWNELSIKRFLQPGQRLKLYIDGGKV